MMSTESAGQRRVLFLSHSHAFGPFRVGSHHYAREFAQRGVEVLHLSTPISQLHRRLGRVSRSEEAVVPRGLHVDVDGVTHLVPRTTLPVPYGHFSVARELAHRRVHPVFDTVFIDQPLLWDDSVRALSERIVYRPTDLYSAGVKARMQQKILRVADAVVATSAEVLRQLGSIRHPSAVIGNGVDTAYFAPPSGNSVIRPAGCVYVGALDARFDWQQLITWAKKHPDIPFTIAGPLLTSPQPMPSNVDLVGPVPYDKLPALLHRARVGLLPLSHDPINDGRSPMKLYEYLAAGLTVISRETPVIAAEESAGVFTYLDSDFSESLDRVLAHPSPNVSGMHRAEQESWEIKTDHLSEFLRGLSRV